MNKTLLFILLISSSALVWADECYDRLPNISDLTERENARRVCDAQLAASSAQENLRNNGNNSNNINVPYNECKEHFTKAQTPVPAVAQPPLRYCLTATNCSEAIPTATPPAQTTLAIPLDITPDVKRCRGYEAISAGFGVALQSTEPPTYSQDRKIYCVRKSGITADWDSCKSALSMYNSIVVAEAAMQIFQGVQTNRAQGQAQDQYNQRAAT
jgi:hypothetical protein